AVGSPLVAGLVEQRVRLGRAVSVGFEGLVEERRIGAHDRTNARRSLAIPDDVDDLLPVEDRADCLTNLLIGEWLLAHVNLEPHVWSERFGAVARGDDLRQF